LIARRIADQQFDLFVPYISDLPLRDQDDGKAILQPGKAQAAETYRM
jgi:hypothetical protein